MIKPRIRRSFCGDDFWVCFSPHCFAAGKTVKEAYTIWLELYKTKDDRLA